MEKQKKQIKEIILYCFWASITTGINIFLFVFFNYINIPYIISNIISYFIAVVLSYYFNNKYVFQKSENKKKNEELIKMIKYFLIRLISIGIDSFFLWMAVEVLKINLYIGKVLVSIFLIIGTYLANKIFVFRRKQTINN